MGEGAARAGGWNIRRVFAVLLIFIGGVAGAIVLILAVLLCEPCGVTNRIVDGIYKNVSPPMDREMPVTITSFPSSPAVVSIICGRGEGLDCSIPWYAKSIFPKYFIRGKSSPVTRRFHQACVFHDLCYRHGLATYGYSQADCDLMLQEQAFRVCSYLPTSKGSASCQLDAKKVLAGVTLGGAESYRNWDQSTFFEFDPNPSKSERFVVNRVIDHPFTLNDASTEDPEQWLLSFDIKRSGIEVKCTNCPNRPFSETELVEAEVRATERASGSFKLGPANRLFVWLPPRHGMAAPYLLAMSDRRQALAWSSRRDTHNTIVCLTLADPKKLLTDTRLEKWGCQKDPKAKLALNATDLFSPTPFPVILRANELNGEKLGIFATALSSQKPSYAEKCSEKGASLRLYKSTDLSLGSNWVNAQPDCLLDETGASIGDFGLFQYPPIVKDNRHIFLSRSLTEKPSSDVAPEANPAEDLRISVFDINARHGAERVKGWNRYIAASQAYDMMLPVTRGKDDFRVLSVVAPSEAKKPGSSEPVKIYETDLKNGKAPKEIDVYWNAQSKLSLDRSWARRPITIIESNPANETPKTHLVLSRSKLSESSKKPGSIIFEFLVLGRERNGEEGFTAVRSARCTVQYTDKKIGGHPACRRVEPADNATREALQTRLQGAQLLSGRLRKEKSDSVDLALVDACASHRPIIFLPKDDTFDVAAGMEPFQGRAVECKGALNTASLTAGIADIKD